MIDRSNAIIEAFSFSDANNDEYNRSVIDKHKKRIVEYSEFIVQIRNSEISQDYGITLIASLQLSTSLFAKN